MASKKKNDPVSEAALEVVKMEQNKEKLKLTEQEAKEKAIAYIARLAGKIEATNFARSQSNFFTMIMLKQVKDAKEYREQFDMTWEDFCNEVGVCRRWVDEQLKDLKPFKVEFLEAFLRFSGVTLSKIKYLGEAISGGTAGISGNVISYGGEEIAVTPENAEEIQGLLETIATDLEEERKERQAEKKAAERVQKDLHKTIDKKEAELKKLSKEAASKGLTAEEDAFLQRMENLKIQIDGSLVMALDPARIEELSAEPTPRMRAAYISTIDYLRMEILKAYSRAVDEYGDPIMMPEFGPQVKTKK